MPVDAYPDVGNPPADVSVSLGNTCGIYEPGEVLSGRVNLRLGEDVSLYAVYLWVIGQAEITCSDSPPNTRTSFDYEIYMKECYTLWGQGQGYIGEKWQDIAGKERSSFSSPTLINTDVTGRLSSGVHRFEFRHMLPSSLPSSFESHVDRGRHDRRTTRRHSGQNITANVRYLLRVKLDSTNAILRRMCHDFTFIVLRPLDLNAIHRPTRLTTSTVAGDGIQKSWPPLDDCVHVHQEVEPGCRWYPCHSGPVACSLRLDRRAFVPGEDISVNIDIENMNRRDVSKSFVAMTQVVHVYAAGVHHCAEFEVFCISGGSVKAGDNAYYHDIIHIPPLPASGLDGCNIIDIEYNIKVCVMLNGSPSAVLELGVPIVIGTVPYRQLVLPGVHMSPVYQRYNQTSGEIENYTDEDFTGGRHRDVYLYYRCTYSSKMLNNGLEYLDDDVDNETQLDVSDLAIHTNKSTFRLDNRVE